MIERFIRGKSGLFFCDTQPSERIAERLARSNDLSRYGDLPAEARTFHEKLIVSQHALANYTQAGWTIIVGVVGVIALLYVNRYGFDVVPVESAIRASGLLFTRALREIDLFVVAVCLCAGLLVGLVEGVLYRWPIRLVSGRVGLVCIGVIALLPPLVGLWPSLMPSHPTPSMLTFIAHAAEGAWKSFAGFLSMLLSYVVGVTLASILFLKADAPKTQ